MASELYTNLEKIDKIKQEIKAVLEGKQIVVDEVFENYPHYIKAIKQASEIIDYSNDENQIIKYYCKVGDTKSTIVGSAQVGTIYLFRYEPFDEDRPAHNNMHGVLLYVLTSVNTSNNVGIMTLTKMFIEEKVLDTSDATATANDLVKGATAYVNGSKITGTIETIEDMTVANATTVYIPQEDTTSLTFASKLNSRGVLEKDVTYQIQANTQQVASAIGLAPDIIKNNVNILGVQGTFDSNPEEYNAKFVVGDMTTGLTPMKLLVSVEKLDTSNVTNAAGIFSGCYSLGSIPYLNLDKATSIDSICYNCTNLVYMPEISIPLCTSMASAFYNCNNMSTINLVNTGNVRSMSSAFANCHKITNIPNLNYANCNSFYACFENTGMTGAVDLSFVNGDLGLNFSFVSMFNRCYNITSASNLNLATLDGTNDRGQIYNMFSSCTNLTKVSNFYLTNLVSMGRTFQGCVNLTSLENCHMTIKNGAGSTSNLMFSGCSNLTTVPFSLLETLGGYNMQSMFYNCHKLEFPKQINITDRNLYYGLSTAFANCYRFNANDIYFNSTMYTYRGGGSLSSTFAGCNNLSHLNIYNHKNLSSMSNTFQNCTKLHSLNFINCAMSDNGMYSLTGTFINCKNIKSLSNIVGINWANCNSFINAFDGCTNLTSVSEINTFSARDIDGMFKGCVNIDNIPAIIGDKLTWAKIFGVSNDAFNSSIQGYLPKLVNFGGIVNYGKAFTTTGYTNYYNVYLTPAPNLSYQSIMNVINGLYNLYTTYGTTPDAPGSMSKQCLILHTVQLQKLTEADKNKAINKGWYVVEDNRSYPIFE